MRWPKFFLICALAIFIQSLLVQTLYVGTWLYALTTLPGTFFHELMHFITAAVLGGHPTNFSLIPSGDTLGSVQFVPNWYNGAPTGLAPLLLTPLAVRIAIWGSKASIGGMLLSAYLSACSILAFVPSPQDFSIALSSSPISWVLAALMLYFPTRLTLRSFTELNNEKRSE